jgi:hypothetical protein
MGDPINPDHYTAGGIETIDFIEAKGLGYHLGNVVKYLVRWKDKNGIEDLKKARWYLDRFIENESGNNRRNVREKAKAIMLKHAKTFQSLADTPLRRTVNAGGFEPWPGQAELYKRQPACADCKECVDKATHGMACSKHPYAL